VVKLTPTPAACHGNVQRQEAAVQTGADKAAVGC